MKMTHWMVMALSLMMGLDALVVNAQENPSATPAPARKSGVVAADNVNVRGQATLKSEVVTQLQQGDPVTILEEVNVDEVEGQAPQKWYRINLPDNVPVWVHSSFIVPETLTVKATRLNMRKGPGENFSVLGQLEEGEVIKVIETKGDWIKIEAPENAYAYVAAFLVNVQETVPPAEAEAVPSVAETAPAIDPAVDEPVTAEPEIAAPTETEPAPLIAEEVPPELVSEEMPATTNAIPSILSEPLVVNLDTNAPADPGLNLTGEPPVEVAEEQLDLELDVEPEVPKRIVFREGIVKRSTSIQAPTYYILANPYNGRTINYLHSPSNHIVLQDYYGARVLVKGEEMLDERWRKTPVISIETLETVP